MMRQARTGSHRTTLSNVLQTREQQHCCRGGGKSGILHLIVTLLIVVYL